MKECERLGLNPYILLAAKAFTLDPIRCGEEWTIGETLEMMRAADWIGALEWAQSPAPPKGKGYR